MKNCGYCHLAKWKETRTGNHIDSKNFIFWHFYGGYGPRSLGPVLSVTNEGNTLKEEVRGRAKLFVSQAQKQRGRDKFPKSPSRAHLAVI
jgi:hypothetical protein